ncbi:hypothetical protein AB6A40_004893 [Gnathostoma spinigerum]|uniref:Uncharacterized protein n=1 Tax=Gnathostoma spinigerum TaxID=75299 RepID=A0ABD6ELJ7_9BILA
MTNDNTVVTVFDPNSPKYQCCCETVHITTAARLTALTSSIVAIFAFVYALAYNITVALTAWALLPFAVIIHVCLLHGVFTERQFCLVPYLITQLVLAILTTAFLFIYLLGIMISDTMLITFALELKWFDVNDSEITIIRQLRLFTVYCTALICATLLVQISAFDIIYRFRNYLKDRENSFELSFDEILRSSMANTVYATSVDELGIVDAPPKYDNIRIEAPKD